MHGSLLSFKDTFLVTLEQEGKHSHVPQDISSPSCKYLKLLSSVMTSKREKAPKFKCFLEHLYLI
jgi:hypothetical protein